MSFKTSLQPKHIAWILFTMNTILISSIDIYVPAAPYLTRLFGVEESIMKLTFLVNPLLSSLTGIPFGRYSDKIGRRPFIILGISFYLIGSLLCATAPNIQFFFLGRCIQAMGIGGLSVLSGALLADIFTGTTLARYMGILSSLYPIVFAVAPLIGAEILTHLGWRYIFMTNFIAMGLLASVICFMIPETTHKAKAAAKPVEGVAGMRTLLLSRSALLSVMVHAMPICFGFLFTVNSPFIYIDTFLMKPTEYAYIQMIPVLTQFIGAYIYKSIVERVGIARCLKFGLLTTATFILVASLTLIGWMTENPYLFIMIIAIFFLGSTFIISPAATLILDRNRGNKGLTMSYIALMRNITISLIVGITSILHDKDLSFILGSLLSVAMVAALLIRTQLKKI
jgi:MFS transporter, DHA1 family, multidrug resistance protein